MIKNEMENFHWKHLSEEQMKELNPIIRQAVYNILVYLQLAETDELNLDKIAAQEIIDFQKLLLPDYCELPNPDAPWEELDDVIDLIKKRVFNNRNRIVKSS